MDRSLEQVHVFTTEWFTNRNVLTETAAVHSGGKSITTYRHHEDLQCISIASQESHGFVHTMSEEQYEMHNTVLKWWCALFPDPELPLLATH